MTSLLAAIAATCAPHAAPPSSFFLHDGDKVVFFGDSITESGAYERYIENFVLTRFPNITVRFVNSGWSGDRVSGGGWPIDTRLDRDVIAHKPTVVTIMLGMNDGSAMKMLDAATEATFKAGYAHIIDKLKVSLPNARLVLIKPSPYDDINFPPVFAGGYNSTLVQFGTDVAGLAQQAGADCVDVNGPMVDMLMKAKGYDSDTAKRLIPDRIHPEPAGHLVMAEALLKAWNAPTRVSIVDFDSRSQRIVERQGAFVRDLIFGREVSWTQDDECLPFPLEYKNPRVALVIRSSGAMTSLNHQGLRVRNLTAAGYRLLIDDQEVGEFSREQLTDGVELSNLDTPMNRQAWALVDLTSQRAALKFSRWRTIEIGLAQITAPQRSTAMKVMDTLEDAVVHRQRELATPHPHRYKLIPAAQ